MSVAVCTQCGTRLKAPPEAEGRRATCPRCGTKFTIALERTASRNPKSTAVPPKPKRSRGWLLLGGVAIVVMVAAGTLVPRLFRGEDAGEASVEHVANPIEKKPIDIVEPPKPIMPAEVKEPPKIKTPKLEVYDLAKNPDDDLPSKFIARLNDLRKLTGVSPVSLDKTLSLGCRAHAEYVARNRSDPKLAMREEDPSLAGFSDEGRRAATVSLISFVESEQALTEWIGRVSSRLALLNPDLVRVGFGAARNTHGDSVNVLDATRGVEAAFVQYPAGGQKNVPLLYSGGPEVGDATAPPGFPVSLMIPVNRQVSAASAQIADENGNRLPAWVSTPESPLPGMPPAAAGRPHLIGLIPKQPLAPGKTYQARFRFKLDGRDIDRAWEFTTEDDTDPDDAWANKIVARLNEVRGFAGLSPVTLDPELSKGCRSHARYLVLNSRHPATQGLGAHDEDLSLPGASPDGQRAGKSSDIAWGDYEPIDAFEGWLATLYHRVPLLEPKLKRVGFGCARGDKLGWTTVLDLARGREAGPRPREVFYPVADQKGVPLNFPSNEEPNPIPENTTGRAGFPITATFPHQAPLQQSRGTLEDDAGRKVDCWFSSPESPANPKFKSHQGTTVCLIPKSPLEPERTYRVTLTGVMAASEWRKTWKFTTGPAGFGVADGRRRFFDRLNASRRAAGLSPMTADAELSSPCQAHADYLVRNGDRIGKAGFVVTDEDAKLPGFSVAGREIARRAHVFTHAPTTAAQADHLLATLVWRVFALDQRQRRVGLGCGLEIGRGWVNVLDLQAPPDPLEPILFPAPDQSKIPCRGRDEKDVVGFPITAMFPPERRLRNVRATLVDAAGAAVDIRVSSSDVLAILPLRPLQPNTIYAVAINAEVDGQTWRRSWRFTTE